MREMPVIGFAIDGRVLAHRRDHDAVFKRQTAQLDRIKQSTHGETSRREGGLSYVAGRPGFLNHEGYCWMPAALITSKLEAVSRLIRSSISAGDIGMSATPSFFRLSCAAGSFKTFTPAA